MSNVCTYTRSNAHKAITAVRPERVLSMRPRVHRVCVWRRYLVQPENQARTVFIEVALGGMDGVVWWCDKKHVYLGRLRGARSTR